MTKTRNFEFSSSLILVGALLLLVAVVLDFLGPNICVPADILYVPQSLLASWAALFFGTVLRLYFSRDRTAALGALLFVLCTFAVVVTFGAARPIDWNTNDPPGSKIRYAKWYVDECLPNGQ